MIMQSFFPAMTKIVGTLGPKSRSVEVISGCLKVGMSGTFLCFCVILNLFFAFDRWIFYCVKKNKN